MMKKLLLASAAFAFAGVASPALAQDMGGGDENATSDVEIDFRNNLDTSIVTDVNFESDIDLYGDIVVDGDIDVDSAAVAVSDSKQITNGVMVVFDEPTDEDLNSRASNRISPFDVRAGGNVGVNAASGYYNSQANVATIAVATGGEEDVTEEAGGMAQANTTAAQSLTNSYYGSEFDESGQDSYSDNNTVWLNVIEGNGNIGVNAAAGAFNSQQNIMTLAVASDSSLAEATAGVVQFSNANLVVLNNSTNVADAGLIGGAGNIAVNIASGVGNQQHNSLTVAASGAFGGNATGGTGNGGL